MKKEIKPGIYSDLTNEQYHNSVGISKSGLAIIAEKTPLHYWAAYLDPEREPRVESEVFKFGTAAHKIILEPEDFHDDYLVMPESISSLSGTGSRTAKNNWTDLAESKGKIVLKSPQMKSLTKMSQRIIDHPEAGAMLSGGLAEQSFYWEDSDTGVLCKCRPDYWIEGVAIPDYKTTADAKDAEFAKSCAKFTYDIQAAFYSDGVLALTGESLEMPFVAQEKESPYALNVFFIDPSDVAIGRDKYKRALDTFARCVETDNWPGYPTQVRTISLPAWSRKQFYRNTNSTKKELSMNEISTMKKTETNAMLFDDKIFGQLEKIATMMVSGNVMVPKHLKTKGDLFAVVMQAAQWGMNPYAVAQKTFLVSGTLGYEAQLVNAVISTSTAIKGRFHYEYGGDWPKISGLPTGKKQIPDKYNAGQSKWIDIKGWKDEDEIGLWIKVGAVISGEDEVTWSEEIYMAPITTRNSSLWVSDPKQQMAYLGVKKWARMYTPGVILGVYTPDELEARDITPVAFEDLDKNDKLEAHKAKVKVNAGKKKAVIEGTAEEVTEVQNEETEKPEPGLEPIKPPTLKAYKVLLAETITAPAMKDRQSEIKLMKGANKEKATELFKERLAELRAPKKEEAKEPRPIDDAYRMMALAKTEEELQMAFDRLMEINKEGDITKDEMVAFDVEHCKKHDEITGGA